MSGSTMKVIGLTGGIGSGKSTVARLFAEHGARVIDADKIGHDVYRPGTSAWEGVVAAFGRDVIAADGTIDRAVLGRRVFADPAARARLNAIVHPLIGMEIQTRLEAARQADDGRPVVIEAALLLDAGWRPLADVVVVVVAPRTAIFERLQAQRGLAAADVEARIAAQIDDDARRRLADIVIENDGGMDDLRAAVHALWEHIVGRESPRSS
jgi:dephospho-CoA kinase